MIPYATRDVFYAKIKIESSLIFEIIDVELLNLTNIIILNLHEDNFVIATFHDFQMLLLS